ncbi:FAD-dependent oxidoreductase, partial [bacterium]|nr:FAD-dependent oxidoreductase [candidate division CSSED10-310 bacterium]
MQGVADRLADPVRPAIRLNRRVVHIDPDRHAVTLDSGESLDYATLILTNPLPEIVAMTENLPDALRNDARQLEYLSVLCVNIGVHRPRLTDKHWIYFPEPAFLFHRVFVQGNAGPGVCPDGCFSYTAEMTYTASKPIDFSDAGCQTIDGLIRAGLMDSGDPVDVVDLIDIPVAYIVPTLNRGPVVDSIRRWYAQHDIHLLGRFAEWEYYNMDHALNAGWALADSLNGTQ